MAFILGSLGASGPTLVLPCHTLSVVEGKLEESVQRPGHVFAFLMALRWAVLEILLCLSVGGLIEVMACIMLGPWSPAHMISLHQTCQIDTSHKGGSYHLDGEIQKLREILPPPSPPEGWRR